MKVILASQSPRRREILQNLNIDFDVIPSNCDEICGKTEPKDIVCELAERKAKSINSSNIVIGSDTIVVCDGKIFGKPKSEQEAYQMLKCLQNSWHTVYTGVCIIKDYSPNTYYEHTNVHIKALTDKEIYDYIQTGEPMDKAGAYAIQGIGAKFVDKYIGEYETIVGLPVKKLKSILKSMNVPILQTH